MSTSMQVGMGINREVIPVRRGREEEKGKEKENVRERKERKKERMRRKGERKMEKRKSIFRRSELGGPRSKVCIFDKGYAQRGRNSSYFGLFPP